MQILFTKSGFEKVKKDRDDLVKQRPIAVLDLKKAREMGDLSENGYYKAARFKLNDIDRNIRQFNYLVKFAVIANNPTKGVIDIGSEVGLIISGKSKKYSIVGKYEADPSMGKLSFVSPLGKALLRRRVGEKISIDSPSGIKQAEVVKISP